MQFFIFWHYLLTRKTWRIIYVSQFQILVSTYILSYGLVLGFTIEYYEKWVSSKTDAAKLFNFLIYRGLRFLTVADFLNLLIRAVNSTFRSSSIVNPEITGLLVGVFLTLVALYIYRKQIAKDYFRKLI